MTLLFIGTSYLIRYASIKMPWYPPSRWYPRRCTMRKIFTSKVMLLDVCDVSSIDAWVLLWGCIDLPLKTYSAVAPSWGQTSLILYAPFCEALRTSHCCRSAVGHRVSTLPPPFFVKYLRGTLPCDIIAIITILLLLMNNYRVRTRYYGELNTSSEQ